jgi:hypothetical protein
MILTLPTSTSDTRTNHDITLLRLVTETVSLVGTRGAVAGANVGALTVLPSTEPHQEAKRVRLLVAVKLFHILVATHDEY